MPIIKQTFGEAVSRILKEKQWSYRRAKIATGIDHYTIGEMAAGAVPKRGVVIEWAQALKEPINPWLALAGYDPIPPELVEGEKHPGFTDYIVDGVHISIHESMGQVSEEKLEYIAKLVKDDEVWARAKEREKEEDT